MNQRSNVIDALQHTRFRKPGLVDTRVLSGLYASATDLFGWYAADSIDQADASQVFWWPDISGLNHHAFASGGTCTFHTNEVNGYPAIQFSGSKNFMHDLLSPSTGSTYMLLYSKDNGAGNDAVLIESGSSYSYLQYGSTWYVGSANTATVAMTTAQFYLKCATMDGTTIRRYTNAVEDGSGSSGTFKGAYKYIGGSGFAFAGFIAEAVIINRAISTAERQAWEAYFQAKYALW